MAVVLKTTRALTRPRGFESHTLRCVMSQDIEAPTVAATRATGRPTHTPKGPRFRSLAGFRGWVREGMGDGVPTRGQVWFGAAARGRRARWKPAGAWQARAAEHAEPRAR